MNKKHLPQLLRRAPLLTVSLALAAALLVLARSTLAAPPRRGLARITSASDGLRDSHVPSLSADGTVVAFESDSDLLNEGRPPAAFEIWLYDTATMTYTRVTASSGGSRDSQGPSLSADGTVVAFSSDSDLLNEGRPSGVAEIWLCDTTTLTYTRVTSASDGLRDSRAASLSADGTVVAFQSDSDFLGQGVADEQLEIWLYDTTTMAYTRVTTATGAGDRDSRAPSLSADGTVVAFSSDSDFLGQGIADGQHEVWLYDTTTMAYTRVTTASGSLRSSGDPSLNADGTVVAFTSDSDLLGQGIADDQYEIWLYDTTTTAYTRVTTAAGTGERHSRTPSLSRDGMAVAFSSDSDFLGQGIADDQYEIWLYDATTMAYTRITTATGTGDRISRAPSLSRGGMAVAFSGDSDFLGQGIADDQYEIWLWEGYYALYLPLVLRQ